MPDKVALFYTGDAEGNPFVSGVPARDLTEADLVHLATRRGTTPTKLADELLAGPYRKPATPAPKPEG